MSTCRRTLCPYLERIILTHDLDFGRIVVLSRARTPSVVTFRLDNLNADKVNRQLDGLITRFAANLERGVLISVTEKGAKAQKIPAFAPLR